MEYNPSKIRNYYFSLKKLAKFFYLALFFGSIFLILIFCMVRESADAIFWIFSGIVIFFSIILALVFWRISSSNLEISKAIFSISNQIMPDKMPIPQDKRFGIGGFGDVLKFIFSKDHHEKTEKQTTKSPALPEIMNTSAVGFCVLNSKNKTVFKNKLSVNFDKINASVKNEIFQWLASCRQSKIRDSKIWERVSNISTDEESQKFYDIAVFFENQFESDAAVFFIDKSTIYENDENDLNFIAFAAHEIRGPITIIRGYLDILSMELGGFLSDSQKEIFTRLVVSSNKLSGYVNNILNVAKLSQNRLNFSTSECSVAEIFDTIREDVEIRASSQNRQLEINLPHNLPPVSADIYGSGEVFTNLIDNAIKYSNDGGLVKVYADTDENFVNIHIQDFGIGMSGAILKNLFNKFYRSHRSRETVAGSGIGLYISKAITEMSGGKISVSSKEGKGSTFTVSLPIFGKTTSQVQTSPKNTIIKNHGRITQ